jgi:hypothetical protein
MQVILHVTILHAESELAAHNFWIEVGLGLSWYGCLVRLLKSLQTAEIGWPDTENGENPMGFCCFAGF